jgi:cephalosporin hydroxylase
MDIVLWNRIAIRVCRLSKGKTQDPAVNVNCSEFEVNNWIISEFIFQKLVPIVGITPYPINELTLMVSAVCRLKPTHIFEWGTYIGKSARIFYETARHFGFSTEIHSIDLPDEVDHHEHPREKRGMFVKGIPAVRIYKGDGVETALGIYRKVSEICRPLVYIDGDHSYSAVKRELGEIIKNMPNASILLHDTFYQSAESGYNIGPCQAITDTLSNVPHKYKIISTNTGLPGMTLLYHL